MSSNRSSRLRRPFLSLAVGALALSGVAGQAFAINIVVPDDHATIQGAIDAAALGDVILVHPGTYVENLDYKGKDVIVRSTAGYPQTTIDGNLAGTVVTFENGETRDAVLDGFTITNGLGVARPPGGIYCGNASPTIRRCLILGNQGSDASAGAGGLQCGFASPEVRNCIFRRNRGGGGASPAGPGAMKLRWQSSPHVVLTVFEENRGADSASAPGAGVLGTQYFDSVPGFYQCSFTNNVGGDHTSCADPAGAGVMNLEGAAVFSDCSFTTNLAGRGEQGPGVARLRGGAIFFTACSFVENVGSRCPTDPDAPGGPGAIFSDAASPQISFCEFVRNRGGGRNAPGALVCTGIGATQVADCSFVENVGGFGSIGAAGAIRFSETNHVTSRILRSTFERNVAGGGRKGGPGAVRAVGGGQIVHCLFVENQGADGFRGDGGAGAVFCGGAPFLSIDACRFLGNRGGAAGHDQNDAPGAAHSGPGAVSCQGGDPVLRNCVMARNVGGSSLSHLGGAGALEIGSSDALVSNCTLVDNVAGTGLGAARPSGLRLFGAGQRRVVNSILWNDTGPLEVTGAGLVDHSLVRGGFAGAGNLDADPRLVDPSGDDFHLRCSSPCRDTGTSDLELPAEDYEGDPRSLGAAVDIGADEYGLPGAGSSYCVSTPNSTGFAALIDAGGCNSVGDGVLPLRAVALPDTFGAFFYGVNQLQAPFGNGTLCVAGTLFRLPFMPISGGEMVHALDYASPPAPAGQITAGSTWNFQAIFRDAAAGNARFDLTNGLQIAFAP